MNKLTLSWKVRIEDVSHRGEFFEELTVLAASASKAEKRAIEICGVINNGKNYVYKLQATFVSLVAIAR